MSREEKISNKQMRILRLRYDALNREFKGNLKYKRDYEDYTIRLRQLVDRALKNSGFVKQPVYIDRSRRAVVRAEDMREKGRVTKR